MRYDVIRKQGAGLGEWALAQVAGSRALPVVWMATRRIEATYRRVRARVPGIPRVFPRVLPLDGLPWVPPPPSLPGATATGSAGGTSS